MNLNTKKQELVCTREDTPERQRSKASVSQDAINRSNEQKRQSEEVIAFAYG